MIKTIHIQDIWGTHQLQWNKVDPHVNIMVGENGGGKTTVLAMLKKYFNPPKKKSASNDIEIEFSDTTIQATAQAQLIPCYTISTFDIPLRAASLLQGRSPLLYELEQLIYPTGKEFQSFNSYRLKATQSNSLAELVNNRIKTLFAIIDALFESTGKKIAITGVDRIVFHQGAETLKLSNLSSGEKQLLLILFKVFLSEEQACVLLMDEPEISLHMEWQDQLIDVILKLNPNAQLFIATHSPNIFANGWSDKLVFMDDILSKIPSKI